MSIICRANKEGKKKKKKKKCSGFSHTVITSYSPVESGGYLAARVATSRNVCVYSNRVSIMKSYPPSAGVSLCTHPRLVYPAAPCSCAPELCTLPVCFRHTWRTFVHSCWAQASPPFFSHHSFPSFPFLFRKPPCRPIHDTAIVDAAGFRWFTSGHHGQKNANTLTR